MPGQPANLAGTMPGDTVNGWFTQVDDLLGKPDMLRIGIVVYDVDTIKRKVATGQDTPVVQIRHVEVVPDGDTDLREQVAQILRNLQRARLGDEQLELTYQPGAAAPVNAGNLPPDE